MDCDFFKIESQQHESNQLGLQHPVFVIDPRFLFGFYLRFVTTQLQEVELAKFPCYEEIPGLPRVLWLGDSISLGIRRAETIPSPTQYSRRLNQLYRN